MKYIFKTLFIGLVVFGTTVSCEEDTGLAIDELYENVDTSGSVIRTLEGPALFVYTTPDGDRAISIDVTIEVQQGDGSGPSTFKEVRVFQQLFSDQDVTMPLLDDQGNELQEILKLTLPASEFVESPVNKLPSTSFSITGQSVVDDNSNVVLPVPTFIATRLELELADGTVVTNTSVGASVSAGLYFNASFFYKTIFFNQ